MKCAGPAILAFALLAVPRASPLPAKEPSTSRYIFGGHDADRVLNIPPKQAHTKAANRTPKPTQRVRPVRKGTTPSPNIPSNTTNNQVVVTLQTPNGDVLVFNDFLHNFQMSNSSSPNVNVSPVVLINKPVRPINKRISTTARPVKLRVKTTPRLKGNPGTTTKSNKNVLNTSTFRLPIKIINSHKNHVKHKNHTRVNTKKKPTPVVHKIISKWSDKPPYGSLKQGWSEHGIPIPTPNPEISSHSPPYPINAVDPANVGQYADYEEISQPIYATAQGGTLNQLAVDFLNPANAAGGIDPNCPTVYLTNSIYGAKQDCADMNIAINTHVNQNPFPNRIPAVEGDDPLQAASSADSAEVAPSPSLATADFPAVPVEAAAAPVSGGGAPAIGGGLPGLPEFPGLPELPDLGQFLKVFNLLRGGLGYLGRLLRFLSPLLWIIPLASFALGFSYVLPFYPWWLPFAFLLGKKKQEPPPPDVVFHRHPPVMVHHSDGWFWNHNTNQWSNVYNHVHARNYRDGALNQLSAIILKLIERFDKKYRDQNSQSWKRRKKAYKSLN